ncbi:hypothetical protein OG470_05965 [Micromonospora sp. NBC_00389]|uniref:hypothetical protein n=1 Tax=Micromonospora sp. NBC_00389 TaxID=2903586 RepID=UPI002E1BBBCC
MSFRRSDRPADRAEADRLLDGARAAATTGPSVAPTDRLAGLLAAAASPGRPEELAGEQAALAAFRAARAAPAPATTRVPGRRRLTAGALACLSVFEPYTMGYQAGCDHVVDLSGLEREGRSQSTGAAFQPG